MRDCPNLCNYPKIRISVKADFIMHFSLYRDTDFDIIL